MAIFMTVTLFLDKALKETLDQVLLSGYFDRVPSHQNGVCEEEEEEEPAAAAVTESSEEQTVDPGRNLSLKSFCTKLCYF